MATSSAAGLGASQGPESVRVTSPILPRDLFGGWRLSVYAISLFVIVPLAVILLSFLNPEREIWRHIVEHILSHIVINTLWLVIGVSLVTVFLGVSLAWITAACEFPGRKIFSWALLLPLAVPTYVLAFVSLGLFDYSGAAGSALRSVLGTDSPFIPNMRSRAGVIIVMSLALYPYVYLLARNAFLTQGTRALEAAQSLGYSRVSGFFKVALPMARPWIAGGLMLVIMETLADFGAVSIFNYDTFTTAIYKAWFGFFSLAAAAQLSSILVLIVFVIIIFEQRVRRRMRFTHAGRESHRARRFPLHGAVKWMTVFYAAAVLTIAFIVPALQLASWSLEVFRQEFNTRYFSFFLNSLTLALLAATVTCFCALILSYSNRRHPDRVSLFFVKTSTLGYALPGSVLAVGVFIPVAYVDNRLVDLAATFFGIKTGPILGGTLFVMALALMVRFMAAGFNSIDSSMGRITRSIDEVSRIMGLKGIGILLRVHLPMLRTGVITAFILVFVDVMKEMPITLMTRPFGWDTLSVKIYELTSEGEWDRAALPALALVAAGLLPVIMLTRETEK